MAEPKTKEPIWKRALNKVLGIAPKEEYNPFAEENMMPIVSQAQRAQNEIDQMSAVYGNDWLDQPGANRAIIPSTYGKPGVNPYPSPASGVPAGFSGAPVGKGGNAIGPATTYVDPATHWSNPQISKDPNTTTEQEDEAWMAWRDAKKRGTTNDPVGPFMERYLAQGKAAAPEQVQWTPPMRGDLRRLDNTVKGDGFMGVVKNQEGQTMSELSVGLPGTDEGFFPLLGPWLHDDEITALQQGQPATPEMYKKARRAYNQRVTSGQPGFAPPGYSAGPIKPSGAKPKPTK